MINFPRRLIEMRFLVPGCLLMLLSGHACCQAESKTSNYVVLGLVGYNYTDRFIANYSVNGVGGGDVVLSSPDSGGSGVTCCLRLARTKVGKFQVMVRWQVGGCEYLVRDPITGESEELKHFYYKENSFLVERGSVANSKFIETHFYPDGSVKVRLTEHSSRPVLALDELRPDKSKFAKCKDRKNPDE